MHVVANLSIDGGIYAAEFKIANLPADIGHPMGTVTVRPSSDIFVGNLWTDFSIAWPEPMGEADHFVFIAEIELMMFDPNWVDSDLWLRVVQGEDCECIVVVDSQFDIHDAWGDSMLMNCDVECWVCLTAAAESSWSDIKRLY